MFHCCEEKGVNEGVKRQQQESRWVMSQISPIEGIFTKPKELGHGNKLVKRLGGGTGGNVSDSITRYSQHSRVSVFET